MKAVIIGAGQTGRGFLARLIHLSGWQLTLIDSDPRLIAALRRAGEYEISFFGGERKSIRIRNFTALCPDDPSAPQSLADADLILVSVMVDNLGALLPLLQRALALAVSGRFPPILVCENGINPAATLRSALPASVAISEAVLLCTTCSDGIDIRSQDLDVLPYDATRLALPSVPFGFRPEMDFAVFCRRKIYTYNCLSACICYPGAESGYERFEEAANDPEIHEGLLRMRSLLDRVISRAYQVPLKEQSAFSQAAIDKFTNLELRDSISRNARGARRKLGPTERIVGPMRLALQQGEDVEPFAKLAASALRYGVWEGSIEPELVRDSALDAFLRQECGIENDSVRRTICMNYMERSGEK